MQEYRSHRIRDAFERAGDYAQLGGLVVGGTAAVTALLGGTIIVGSIVGTAGGALMGEVLDHVPYFKHAIPDGIFYVANYFDPEHARQAREVLYGNLDKLGATLGFIGGFARSSVKVKTTKTN